MFIDTSAFLAIMLAEPEAPELLAELAKARDKPITSAVVRFEVVMALAESRAQGNPVTARDVERAKERFNELMRLLDCSEVMMTSKVGQLATQAAAIFGEASGHSARLDLGDCMSYAMAKANRTRLLYAGENFRHTDFA